MVYQLRKVWLVAAREIRDQFRDWRIIIPIIVLTLFFPFLMNFAAKSAMNFVVRYGTPLIAERLVPFLLLVVGFFPITVSLIIALEAFVGEKERGTIEPLLSSPLKDWQLYIGKFVASSFAPLLTAYLGIVIYLVGLHIQHISFPDAIRLTQTIILTTIQGLLMVSGAIVISTQATSVRAANLMASFIIVPMALLIQGESILMFWGNNQALWYAIIIVSVLTIMLIRVGIAHFQREPLLGREIDVLNLSWIAHTFWREFQGDAKSLIHWMRYEIPKTLKKQLSAIVTTIIIGFLAAVIGFQWVFNNAPDMIAAAPPEEVSKVIESGFGNIEMLSTPFSFQYIISHNIQVVMLILLLGIFSFGVLGSLAFIANMSIVGAVLALVKVLGYSPTLMALYGLLPHGIFEFPALILSSAAVLYIGAVLVAPVPNRSLGEVLIEAVADWSKIGISLIFPLLVIAAIVETWITPKLLLIVLP